MPWSLCQCPMLKISTFFCRKCIVQHWCTDRYEDGAYSPCLWPCGHRWLTWWLHGEFRIDIKNIIGKGLEQARPSPADSNSIAYWGLNSVTSINRNDCAEYLTHPLDLRSTHPNNSVGDRGSTAAKHSKSQVRPTLPWLSLLRDHLASHPSYCFASIPWVHQWLPFQAHRHRHSHLYFCINPLRRMSLNLNIVNI